MATIDARTGKLISGPAEAFQSLNTALSTQKGTRIMRRLFGADRVSFIDRGIHPNNLVDFYAEIAAAMKFDGRLRLTKVRPVPDSAIEQGQILFDVECIYYPRGHLGDFSEALTLTQRIVWNDEAGEALPA